MLSEVLRRDTLSQAGRARATKNKPQSDAFWSLFGDAVFAVLVKYAGHVVFDYSIPLGFILYLAAASRMEPRKAKAA